MGGIDGNPHVREALRDFVRESNRGRKVWFVSSEAQLDARLSRRAVA
jgi:hypothetical protein